MNKATVIIKYCPKCGWLLRATWMAQELLTTFSDEIGKLSLVPSEPGSFDILVSDKIVWSRKNQQGFPEIKQLKKLVRDIISPGMELGHTDR